MAKASAPVTPPCGWGRETAHTYVHGSDRARRMQTYTHKGDNRGASTVASQQSMEKDISLRPGEGWCRVGGWGGYRY